MSRALVTIAILAGLFLAGCGAEVDEAEKLGRAGSRARQAAAERGRDGTGRSCAAETGKRLPGPETSAVEQAALPRARGRELQGQSSRGRLSLLVVMASRRRQV